MVPPSEPVVSVVIPSYNRKDSVLALLADLRLQQGVPFEVIVVDDASPDGSADAIAAAFPQVVLLRNQTNGGPCVARNRGIRQARAEIVVGLDSDVTIPDRTLIQKAAEALQARPNVVALAFRILQPDGVSDDAPRWWHAQPIQKYAESDFPTAYICGTAFAVRKGEALRAGMFPEILYMHHEEVELAFRLLDDGGDIWYTPALSVLHHANAVSRRSEVEVFYHPRNQILLTIRCFPWLRGTFFLVPRVTFQFLKAALSGRVKDFYRVLRSAVKLAPSCFEERRPLRETTWKRIAEYRQYT